MIKKFLFIITLSTIFALTFSTGAFTREKMSHTEEKNISAAGVEKVRFRDINFTDFTYIGEDGRSSFSAIITYTAKTDDEEEFEEILSDFDFEIFTSDETVTMRLIHPKKRDRGLFKRLFRRKEWRVILDVKGPRAVDLDIDSDFSEILTEHTSGNLVFNIDFTSTICRDHKGRMRTNLDFGEFDAEELDGSFNINADFGDINIELAHLADDSQANISFGNIDIELPYNTGAEFHVNKSFGGIDFQTTGPLTYEGRKGGRPILNDGGCIVDLNADFGSITVRDNLKESKGSDKQPEKDNKRTERKGRKPEPKTLFKEGIIGSIKIRGTRLLDREDIEEMLNISMGKHYTRDAISKEIKQLSDKNRLISSASFTIDLDGNLSVRVYEIEPYSRDFDVDGSFSRVGGLGFGPKLTITSEIGPLSELTGGAQYHWGNKEWTYNILAEKHMFDRNRLVLGGTYRMDYESSMDWAIPAHDSYLNAFLIGRETKNYYQVEGATGYISQSLADIFTIKAEYFEEDYSSLKKHTNWSLFNQRHIKEDNPLLKADSEGRINGMRYSVSLQKSSPITNTMVFLETEKTFDNRSDTLPAYTRFYGNIAQNTRFSYNHLLKLRIAGGYSDDVLPEQKSFMLGGVNTLRGYAFGAVPEPEEGKDGFDYQGGANRMFLANIDYFTGRRGDDLRIVFFGDVGNVWGEGESVDMKDLKRDLGIGLAFEGDFFAPLNVSSRVFRDALRINWAVPVGNVPHVSRWTVNFVRVY